MMRWIEYAPCSGGCGRPRYSADAPRYCRECHNAYARENRPAHKDLPPEQKFKATARAYANVYKRRGKLKPKPCQECGFFFAEMHHEDYTKPLEVTWLCRKCHTAHHAKEKEIQLSNMKQRKKRGFLKRSAA